MSRPSPRPATRPPGGLWRPPTSACRSSPTRPRRAARLQRAVKALRNVSIIVAIAAVVYVVPGSGRATSTLEALLAIGFGVAFAYLGVRLYREHRVAIYSLGDRHRGMLYGAIALVLFAAEARGRMWQTSF